MREPDLTPTRRTQHAARRTRRLQGFCCSCDLSEVLWLSNEQTRAGLTCSLFAFGVDASSAHCLRFDPLWYDVFSNGTCAAGSQFFNYNYNNK